MARFRLILNWLPPAARLPVVAALIVFVVAVATTQVALQLQTAATDSQFRRLGQVYLDGLLASVRPALEAVDERAAAERFRQAFRERQGITERGLFAFTSEGRLLTYLTDADLPVDTAAAVAPGELTFDRSTGMGWIARPVDDGRTGRLVAALDMRELLAARRRLALGLVLVDLALAAAFGFLAYYVLERMGRPIAALLDRLRHATDGPPVSVPDEAVARADPSTAALMTAFNGMVRSMQDRERLAGEAGEREQAAALGRLAATVAHEVRNPLGGLATAVSTLKHFGGDAAVRAESLGLLERGIDAVDRMVTSTLNFYRPEDERRLSPLDFADLEHLVRPTAVRAGLRLDWHIAFAGEVALGAVGVRQVLLNLLLNACAATAPGGVVALSAGIEGDHLVCTIIDGGSGMDSTSIHRLTGDPGHAAGDTEPQIGRAHV